MIMSILKNQVKEQSKITDEVIVDNLMASASAAANAYLNAAIVAPTPELRAIFGSSLEQILNGHTQLSKLAADKDWAEPYAPSRQQLSLEYDRSKQVVNIDK